MGRSRVRLEAKGPLVGFNRFPYSFQILQRHPEIERREGRFGIRRESLTVMDLGRFDLASLVEQPSQVEMGVHVARVERYRTAVGFGGTVGHGTLQIQGQVVPIVGRHFRDGCAIHHRPRDGRDLFCQLLNGKIQMHLLGLGVPNGFLLLDHDGIAVRGDVEGTERLILGELAAERIEHPFHPAQGDA